MRCIYDNWNRCESTAIARRRWYGNTVRPPPPCSPFASLCAFSNFCFTVFRNRLIRNPNISNKWSGERGRWCNRSTLNSRKIASILGAERAENERFTIAFYAFRYCENSADYAINQQWALKLLACSFERSHSYFESLISHISILSLALEPPHSPASPSWRSFVCNQIKWINAFNRIFIEVEEEVF